MQAIKNGFSILFVLILLDLVILFASLAQVSVEGRTGYWSPFWAAQAKAVVYLLN